MKLYIITGACGSGKSTIKDALEAKLDSGKYACIDSDEVGLNWWDYAGTDHESRYKDDTLAEAVKMAEGKDLIFVSCINPQDYISSQNIPECVESTFFTVLCPTDEEIIKRLRERPAERGFTTDEKIMPHVEFNKWFRRNKGKFPLFVDNTEQTVEETANLIAQHIA